MLRELSGELWVSYTLGRVFWKLRTNKWKQKAADNLKRDSISPCTGMPLILLWHGQKQAYEGYKAITIHFNIIISPDKKKKKVLVFQCNILQPTFVSQWSPTDSAQEYMIVDYMTSWRSNHTQKDQSHKEPCVKRTLPSCKDRWGHWTSDSHRRPAGPGVLHNWEHSRFWN